MIAENAQVENDEFINILCTPVQDRGETLSHHVDSLNMHTFYQHHLSEHRWTKDHPLEQVIGNPSQSVRTRCQLELDGEMCMFALTDIGFELTAFSDSDYAGCLDSRKSTSDGIQFLGGDKLVSWSSKKQDCTSMSSAEADHSHLMQSSPAFAYQEHRRQISLHKGKDRNTTPESTDISHRGGEIDQNADAKTCKVSCPLPDPSFDNMTTEFSNKFLESKNISLKKIVA
nr:ribonuclease H-like domain-containing protein [Tanacetum cinerariifolium]